MVTFLVWQNPVIVDDFWLLGNGVTSPPPPNVHECQLGKHPVLFSVPVSVSDRVQIQDVVINLFYSFMNDGMSGINYLKPAIACAKHRIVGSEFSVLITMHFDKNEKCLKKQISLERQSMIHL